MKKSDRTKQCRNRYILYTVLHFLCLFGPFLYFIPYAFIVGTPVEKISLSLVVILALCLSALTLIVDAKNRGGLSKTIMWTLIMGVMICLAKIEVFIFIMAAVSIVDELIVVKMRAKYKDAYAANVEIDRRNK